MYCKLVGKQRNIGEVKNKMKINKLSLCGYILGIMIIILTTERWWFRIHDISNFLIFSLSGCFIIAFAYIYTLFKNNEKKFEELNKDMQSFETNFNKILTWKNDLEIKKEEEKLEGEDE